MKRTHVCSVPGCPHLTPCPDHARPRNARWSRDRDPAAHERFRRALIARSYGHCERCGAPGTVAHHIKPGYSPECGIYLCDDCHTEIDEKARRTRRGSRTR